MLPYAKVHALNLMSFSPPSQPLLWRYVAPSVLSLAQSTTICGENGVGIVKFKIMDIADSTDERAECTQQLPHLLPDTHEQGNKLVISHLQVQSHFGIPFGSLKLALVPC